MNQPSIPSNFRIGILAIVLGSTLGWVACNSPNPIEKKPFVLQPISKGPYQLKTGVDTLVYTLYYKAAYEHNPDEYSQSDSTTIQFWYPLIDSSAPEAVRTRINAQIQAILLQETPYQTVEERLEGFIAEFKVHKKDMQEFNLPSSNWAFDMRLSVLTNTPTVLALRVDQLEFTGGAHANSWTRYRNYHAQSGQELLLKDIFWERTQDAWLPLARAAYWQTWQAQDSSQRAASNERDTSDFVLPRNFSIGTDGLHFYYDPYDAEAYALTALSFSLSYDALLPYVDTTVLPLREGIQ